ncbi:hypothetical protein AAMO2058_001527800 [Amorphochlora amoebiformis]
MEKTNTVEPILVSYDDLKSGKDLSELIEKAYGYQGLGILAVTGISEVGSLREALFKDGYKFANLEDNVKSKYEHKDSYYSFGWSHGKEKLQGHPDYSKGSYYNNPLHNKPYDDPKLIEAIPSIAHPNIWPSKEIPTLEKNFMDMGQLIVKVGCMIAAQCDLYVASQSKNYTPNRLYKMLSENKACKARLLHYFPIQKDQSEGKALIRNPNQSKNDNESKSDPFSSWCGWHNDHSSLTGLVIGQFVDTQTGKFLEGKPDPAAGLYIRSRTGGLFQIQLPKDKGVSVNNTLLFQIGESSQIHSGGILQATPHAVRGANVPKVSRESYAVFMQPKWDEVMNVPKGVNPKNAQSAQAAKQLPSRVPTLASRYGTKTCPFTTCNYAAFTQESLSAYH